MSRYIMLPRSWLDPQITDHDDFLKAAIYLAKEINEHGSVSFSSGDANMRFGMSPRRYRTFMKIITSDKLTDKEATNTTTNISFECQDITATTRQAKRQTGDKPSDKQKRTANRTSDYISPPFVSPEYTDIWKKFIQYRKEIKKPYKSESSERTAYNKMVEMAGGDPVKARDMVDRAILGQWQGLYANKERPSATANKPVVNLDKVDESTAQRNELYNREYLHGEALAEKLKGFRLSPPEPVLPGNARNTTL